MTVFVLYSQHDVRWCNLELAPGVSVKSYGCLLCALSGMLKAYSIADTPDILLAKLKAVGGIIQEGADKGNIIWDKIREVYPQLSFMGRTSVRRTPADSGKSVESSLKSIRKTSYTGVPVLLHIDATGDGRGDHWVLLVEPDTFTVADPWYKELAPLTKRYGAPEKVITGWGVILGTPIDCPEGGDIDKSTAAAKVMQVYNHLNDRKIKDDLIFYLKEAAETLIM